MGTLISMTGPSGRGSAELSDSFGVTLFVDSVSGNSGNSGRFPDRPLATIQQALDKCTANAGDTIVCAPTHAETVLAAAGLDLDIAGVTIVGLGTGNKRPTITFTTSTSADVDIDAANITIRNFRFVTDVASLLAPIDVNAAGFTMEDCDFYGNNAAAETNLITVITDATADDMTIRRCTFNYLGTVDATPVTTVSTECIRLVGADRAVIEDCYISGDFTTSAINGITTASLDIQIVRNQIVNIATENIPTAVDLVAGCRGVIGYNYGFSGYATDIATVIDPSSCAMIQNFFSNVVTEAGGLVGTASA